MPHLIDFKRMKANLHTALNRFNPKRKKLVDHEKIPIYGSEVLHHPKIPARIETHVTTMLFKKTNLGLTFWRKAVNGSFKGGKEIKESIDSQLKKIIQVKGINEQEARTLLMQDLATIEEARKKLRSELDKATNKKQTKLEHLASDAYNNASIFYNLFIQLAKEEYKS